MDIQQYAHIKLSSRRPNFGAKRSELDEEIDFTYIVQLKEAGASWIEITELINSNRDYFTTEKQNRSLYEKKMLQVVIKSNADDAAETEKNRILEDLDWIHGQAVRMWNNLKHIQEVQESSGYGDEKGFDDADEEDDDLPSTGKKGKKFIRRKTGLIEQHQAKYLETALRALDLKAKISGVGELERKELGLIEMLKDRMLDDGGSPKNPLVTSEAEVLAVYGDAFVTGNGFELAIEEILEEKEEDDHATE